MIAVQFLAKLYDMPSEYGTITALDSYGNNVYGGTSTGTLFRCSIEGMEEYASTDDSSHNKARDHQPQPQQCSSPTDLPESIFTNLVGRAVVSDRGKPIADLQHSRSHTLLFVLCDDTLSVWNSAQLTYIANVAVNVNLFFVYLPTAASVPGSEMDSSWTTTATGASAAGASAPGTHYICISQAKSKMLEVYELDASLGQRARAVRTQQLQLPEAASALVVSDGVACVGMRHEYALLSLTSGAARTVLQLSGNRPPLIALGDGEVHLRYHNNVFTAASALPAASYASGAGSGGPAGRTLPVGEEAQLIVSRFPFVMVFTASQCVVFSAYEDDPVERLPLPDCRHASQLARGGSVFVAGPHTLWMIRLSSLRRQLADLVDHFRVEEAFALLEAQRSRSNVSLQALEFELHVMAGFEYLHHGRCHEAMFHFGEYLDPRELLLHLPECAPRKHSEELAALLRRGALVEVPYGEAFAQCCEASVVSSEECPDEEHIAHAAPSHSATAARQPLPGMWEGWRSLCPYNSYQGDIQRVWLQTYESFPSCRQTGGTAFMLRLVPELGEVTAAVFLEKCWECFKDAMWSYFLSRLHKKSIMAVTTTDTSRLLEYALLLLALERQDHHAAHHMVCTSRGLQVEDVYDLLNELHEYRLLSCLLYRRGYLHEAQHLLKTRVNVSSYFGPLREVLSYSSSSSSPPTTLNAFTTETLMQRLHTAESAWRRRLDAPASPAMAALLSLPPGARQLVAEKLLGFDSGDSVSSSGDSCPAARFHSWLTNATHRYVEKLSTNYSSRLVYRLPGSDEVLMSFPHTGKPLMALDGALAPSAYAELFYLIDKMNVVGIAALLAAQPDWVHVRDAEGHGPLHHLFSLLHIVVKGGDTPQGVAALQLMLSAASILVDAGCPTDTISAFGMSALDVAASATDDGSLLDVVAAAMLSFVSVKEL